MNLKRKPAFWIGNALLVVATLMLVYMGPLSERLGTGAMALWMIVAGAGIYLITRDKGDNSMPD
jgi:hypothetical protein